MVRVGMPVARHPPYRSRRALLTHRAPPLGTSVKSHKRVGMHDADVGKEAVRAANELGPIEIVALAAPPQRPQPVPADLREEGPQDSVVPRDGEVIQVPLASTR